MSAATRREARLNFRLSADLKALIEEAAAQLGQTVSDFAIATLLQTARQVIHQQSVTELSNRDRDRFLALLDSDTKPNRALREAAKTYKKQVKALPGGARQVRLPIRRGKRQVG